MGRMLAAAIGIALAFGGTACAGNNNREAADTVATAASDSTSIAATSAPAVDKDSVTLTIAMVGDVMMGTTFPDSVNSSHLPANDGRDLFSEVREITRRADLAGLNCEGSFLDGPGKRRMPRNPNDLSTYYLFRMPTRYVENLVDAGFDFAGIANNHINDFGAPGRESTMKTLQDAGIRPVGLTGKCETAIFTRKGLRIGVTQFGHGANNLDVTSLQELRRVLKNLRDSADVVLASFHGGAEGRDKTHVPRQQETFVGENRGNVHEFAHAAIDAGADIVLGHGPHVPRAAELYKGRIIFYSLGNFCTPYRVSIAGISGYAPLVELQVNGRGEFLGGKIHSYIQRRGQGPVKDPAHGASRLIRQLSEREFPSSGLQVSDTEVSVRK